MHYPNLLLAVQNFPQLQNSFIGKDVLPDYFVLLEYFLSYLAVDKHILYEDRMKVANYN